MPKVLFNLPSQHAGRPSGVSVFAFQLLNSLVGRSEFDYVLRSPWRRDQLPEKLRDKKFETITVPRPPFLLLNVFWQALFFRRLCRRHKIDLLVNLDPYGSASGGLARLMVVHDLYFRTIRESIPRSVRFTNGLIHKIMLWGNCEIIAVSESTKRDLEHWYPQAKGRTVAIHSGISLNLNFTESPIQIAGRFVLTVGNATANKNFSVLAEALASVHSLFPEISAVVHVGHDPDETIASTLRNIGSPLQVLRFQAIDDAKLASLYQQASCLCIPSLYEGFCLPILEAQALGCPVICSDRPALPEIAGSGAIFVDPTDPKALAGALLQVLQDPEISNALRRAGYENSSKFSWDLTASNYEAVFRKLLGRHIAEKDRLIHE
jgi:glycosyltransferase involved in cell wall biosynthesis